MDQLGGIMIMGMILDLSGRCALSRGGGLFQCVDLCT
jgi:hypothetical protein